MTGEGEVESSEYTIISKGGLAKQGRVWIWYRIRIEKNINKVVAEYDRMLAIKILSKQIDFLFIKIQMPTSDTDKKEVDRIYKQVQKVYRESD